jgi:hypothetical protein
MIKGGYNRISGRAHPHLMGFLDKIYKSKIVTDFVNFFTPKKKKEELAKADILKYGLILLGLNVSLALVFCFSFILISILTILAEISGILIFFIPPIIIFIFSAASAVLWYRFGQILGNIFRQRKVLNSSLTVLVSLLPLMLIFIIIAGIVGILGSTASELLVVMVLGFLLMSVLAGAFELLIVSMGAITTVK